MADLQHCAASANGVPSSVDGKETQVTDASLPCRLTCACLRTAADLLGAGKGLLVSAATDQPIVALTIDDGPHLSTTPALLDVLDRHEAKATFFLIGERAAHRGDLVGAIVARGHQLGNHLWRDRPSVRLPREQFRHELWRVHEELRPHDDVSVFRPGSGWFTPQMLRDGTQMGYRCVLGSPWLLATEYRGDPVMQGRRLGLRAHAGAIAVLHEGTNARRAVAAVADGLLTALADRGLQAVTVRDLLTAAMSSGPPRAHPACGSPPSRSGWQRWTSSGTACPGDLAIKVLDAGATRVAGGLAAEPVDSARTAEL